MLEIRENQELSLEKLLCYRGRVKQTELENICKDMDSKVQSVGGRPSGNPITATYGIEGEYLDVEILLPIDKEMNDIEKYVFKKKIHIVNAVVALYKGHPTGLQDACNQLNQYIIDNRLQPITVGYNVTRKTDMMNLENTEIDVYVGINPNIL